MQVCHHFAGPMVARGRGGIVLLSSGAGFVGAPNMVAYGATKAFDTVLAEALWAELHDQGVDVLGLVLGLTDTPALRRLLAERGQLDGPDDPSPIPGAASAEAVAALAVENLADGPDRLRRRGREDGGRALRHPVAQRRGAAHDRGGRGGHGRRRRGRLGIVNPSWIDAADRQDIADLLVQYATGVDRRDWDLFRACFTDDCVADYGDIGVWHSADEMASWMEEAHRECGYTLHRITNQTVEVDSNSARARCYVDAVVMFADNQSGVRAVGFYDDELVRTGEGWRISRRHYTSVILQMGIGNDAIS